MKSLLVDALRQAKNLDEAQVLSDSGSYDTTKDEFLATANDAVAEQSDIAEQELALYETINKSLEVSAAVDTVPAVELQPTVAIVGSGPRQARFAPLICMVLAVLAASIWLGYQQVRLGHSESAMDMSQAQNASVHTQRMNASADQSNFRRFPFLPAEVDADEQEVVE